MNWQIVFTLFVTLPLVGVFYVTGLVMLGLPLWASVAIVGLVIIGMMMAYSEDDD